MDNPVAVLARSRPATDIHPLGGGWGFLLPLAVVNISRKVTQQPARTINRTRHQGRGNNSTGGSIGAFPIMQSYTTRTHSEQGPFGLLLGITHKHHFIGMVKKTDLICRRF